MVATHGETVPGDRSRGVGCRADFARPDRRGILCSCVETHICHVFPTFGLGGVEIRTVRFMSAFPGRFRHTVIALDGVTGSGAIVPETVDVNLLSGPRRTTPHRSWLASNG